jgi:chromosome segregation ATPase
MTTQMLIPEHVGPLLEQLRSALSDMERYADEIERIEAAFKTARKKLPEFANANDAEKAHRAAKKQWERTNAKSDAQARCEAEKAAKAFRAELKKEAEKLNARKGEQVAHDC